MSVMCNGIKRITLPHVAKVRNRNYSVEFKIIKMKNIPHFLFYKYVLIMFNSDLVKYSSHDTLPAEPPRPPCNVAP